VIDDRDVSGVEKLDECEIACALVEPPVPLNGVPRNIPERHACGVEAARMPKKSKSRFGVRSSFACLIWIKQNPQCSTPSVHQVPGETTGLQWSNSSTGTVSNLDWL
jgi:hypothetical protein